MTPRCHGDRRAAAHVAPLVAAVLVLVLLAAACAPAPSGAPTSAPTGGPGPSDSTGPATPGAATPRPAGGREVYGYVPYWEMDGAIAEHLAATPLTTLALFSVTDTNSGALNTSQRGYKRITGDVGAAMIRAARDSGARVELVFTSFGRERNDRLFDDVERQDRAIAELVDLVGDLGLDGINVDVEGLDPEQTIGYGDFVRRLRAAVVAADPADQVSVATQANLSGATMAAAAAQAGADRIFMMGYDYRVNGSEPGAVAPLDRRDGEERDLVWSLDLYEALGVPVERTILGLPLYGRTWPVTDPEIGAPATATGETWIPSGNAELLQDPTVVPQRDEIEVVELYAFEPDGSPYRPAPTPGPTGTPGPTPGPGAASPSVMPTATPTPRPQGTWRAVYVDSPATLATKAGLAIERGLAGIGFWAIGYERGLPAYTAMMERFASGEPME